MAQAVRVQWSRLSWIIPLFMTAACSTYTAGSFERPYFIRNGLLALSSDYYTVRAMPGDTYMGLAWEHNVSPYEVISINQVKAPYRLEPGDMVRIPTPRIHVVRRDETLSAIADSFHVDFYDLAQANALNAPYTIFPGQVLRLPASGPVFKSSRKPPVRASLRPPDMTHEIPEPVPEKPPRARLPAKPRPRPAEFGQAAALPRPKPRTIAALVPPKPAPALPSESTAERQDTAPQADAPEAEILDAAPENASKGLIWPVRGRIISGFGPTGNGRHNDGINIAVPEHTPVRAAADGVIIYCGNEVGGFGNLVLIQHADDLVTAYAHASEIKVRKGEEVRKGQAIALSGSTGNVEEPQLHFEVRRGVKAVDPVEHLQV